MSAVLETPTLSQRKGLAAYNAARAAALHHGERRALRTAEQEWRAEPRPVVVHRTRARTTRWQRLRAAFRREFGRRWLLGLIGTALYFTTGTAMAVALLGTYAGWWLQ